MSRKSIGRTHFKTRVFSILIIVSLLLSASLHDRTKAFGDNKILNAEIPPMSSQPVEEFKVQSPKSKVQSWMLEDIIVPIIDLFTSPDIPQGLEAARLPTLGENITSSIVSFFSLFNPTASASAALTAPPPPATNVKFDFDGDSRSDIARWKPTNAEWRILFSSNNTIDNSIWGSSGEQIAPADYNGDGVTDRATFNRNDSTWKIQYSGPQADSGFQLSETAGVAVITALTLPVYEALGYRPARAGAVWDQPVAGDFDGDGRADLAAWNQSNGTWYVRRSLDMQTVTFQFGQAGDIPVPGDYDGDRKTDPAVFRPSTGNWHVMGSLSGTISFQWGVTTDFPVPADYDGDNKTDFAVYRGSTGSWYAYKSSTNNGTHLSATWGNYGDQPVPSDYDGDNKADFAVWRPTTGVWHILKSQSGTYEYYTLGVAGDVAVESAYLKQIGGAVSSSDLNNARLSPKNATGGTDLYSQNFSWGTSLVGLPGRAGLNAGFGISYNSLVWTKQGNAIYFDTDNSNVTPGFRFGFPVIEPSYYIRLPQNGII